MVSDYLQYLRRNNYTALELASHEHFVKAKKVPKVKEIVPIEKLFKSKSRASPNVIRKIVFLRYGSEDNFTQVKKKYSEIAKQLHLSDRTVRGILIRFE